MGQSCWDDSQHVIVFSLSVSQYSYQTNIGFWKIFTLRNLWHTTLCEAVHKASPLCYDSSSWDCWSGTSWEGPNSWWDLADALGAFTLHSSSMLSGVLERSGVCGHAPKDHPNGIHTFTLAGKTKQEPLSLPMRHLYVCKQDVGGPSWSQGGEFGRVFFYFLFVLFFLVDIATVPTVLSSSSCACAEIGGCVTP